MVDITGFLTMGHVLTAHITGNLVLMAADVAREGTPRLTQVAIVPVFMLAVAAAWGVARIASTNRVSAMRALLWIQFLLLLAVFVFCSMRQALGGSVEAGALIAVGAMGCQFALLRITLPGSPSTAAMTGNVTDAVLSFLELLSRDPPAKPIPRDRLHRSAQVLAGFVGGCVIAALAVKLLGDFAWGLPAAVAAITLSLRQQHG